MELCTVRKYYILFCGSMQSLKEFLETSTIHGLHYISTSRKVIRLFWTCVVLTGLTGSCFLIQQSFKSWTESPITTTIESQPTSEIQLPKVTVCPPEKTFTDLNFDLVNLNNETLTNTKKDEVIRFAMEVIQDQIHQDTMSDLRKLEEKDRSYNWYNGITDLRLPYYANEGTFIFQLSTFKTSGQVSTQSFGLPFNASFVDKRISIVVYIEIVPELRGDKNVTLHFDIEQNSISGLKSGNDDIYVSGKLKNLKELKTFYKSFTPPGKKDCLSISLIQSCKNSVVPEQNVKLKRELLQEEFENIRMTLMPGFKFSWYYTGLPEEPEETPFLKNPKTKQFIKFTNLVSKVSTNYSNLWSQIRMIKAIFLQKNSKYTCDLQQTILSDALIKENVEKLYEVFDAKNISMQPEKQFSNEMLYQTASMFLYLISCPNSHRDWINFYKDLFSSNNALDLIILTLNRLRKTDTKNETFNYKKFASRIFNFMTEKLYLDHPKFKLFRYPKLTAEKSNNISTGLSFVNHPVHIINSQGGELSPSAFIPFCELGGNMSSLGVKIKEFHIPVCNSFIPKLFHDKICYQIDLEQYRDNPNIETQLKKGLVFIMDYNEDRQVFDYNFETTPHSGLFDRIDETKVNSDAIIFLRTLGKGIVSTCNPFSY